MHLHALTATADPAGNRITIAWENPQPLAFPGIRVIRRTSRYPDSPTDGTLVAQGTGLTGAIDAGLQGETTYYYALFPFAGTPPVFDIDPRNRVSALATSPFGYAGQMYDLLPALYRRYDTLGALRRLLDLPGGQLDQLRSLAQALLHQHDIDQVDGTLLPLLAQWINWPLDVSVDLAAQRDELRAAPAVYPVVGLVPTLEVTVKRILGRESKTKEYAANVAHSNAPQRRNIWARQRTGATWTTPEAPLSLDFGYQGRPATARSSDGKLWLFYHTLRSGRWQLWSKSALTDVFGPSKPLSPADTAQLHPSAVAQGARLWAFWSAYDAVHDSWEIRYRTREPAGWSDDVVFGNPDRQRRRPAAAADDSGGVWLFWQERHASTWITRYARHDGTSWSTAVTFPLDAGAAPRVEDDPIAIGGVAGASARLWLFWARRDPDGPWTIVYRTKTTLGPDASGWSPVIRLSSPSTFDDREPAPTVEAGRVELFFSSNRSGTWSVHHSSYDSLANTWAVADQVSSGPYAERGPMPLPTPAGLWLFTGSNRPVTYASEVYRATRTVDRRYSGSTTVDTRDTTKLALRGHLDDFATYSYATGPNGRYGYDVVGVFLDTAIDLPHQAARAAHLEQVEQGLRRFLPAHVRVILIDSPS
jgi:phage tail-like protein